MFSSNIAQLTDSSQVKPRKICTSGNREEFIINLSDAIADITENIIADSEYSDLPTDIFVNVVKRAINDTIDDFAINPDSYLQPQHLKQIDEIALEYLNF